MTTIRNAVKLTNAGAAIDKLKQERDTYRELCGELLFVVECAMKEVEREDRPYREWHGKALDAITTAKIMIGENNAT